jgi:hypothetical protein
MAQMNSSLSAVSTAQVQSSWILPRMETHLLATFTSEDAVWLAPKLEPVTLTPNQELDRPGLRSFAGDAYGAAEAEAQRLSGWTGLPSDKPLHAVPNQPV